MNPCLIALPILLLTGCTPLKSLPYFNRSEPISAQTPGVAITRDQSPRLASLSFFSDTRFTANHAEPCVRELISVPEQEAGIVQYSGNDVLTTEGLLVVDKRELGLLPSRYRIRFQLAALGQLNGTRYGFSRIRVARKDALGLDNHDFIPIPPAGQTTQQVYRELRRLYQQLDACMAG
ncbi:hypothetical protein [uncultured Oceanisphaera sp.]|uniref:hypothetical protein n=1 Tax=uncultured Oceanisphaera sp. TaxID=353858 RepID=UPI002629DA18|nr:hypothetical protein [uncultured Oceanisphaera sp.]